MTTIRRAIFPDDLPAVTAIFREYVQSPTANLDFQDYEQEFAELPGKYAEPDGGVLLAVVEGRVVGCAALRRVEDGTCELKRVYVRPVARGMDLGRKLVEEMLRDLVRDIIREELQGALGERITRNVRKLVRAEIARAVALRDFD